MEEMRMSITTTTEKPVVRRAEGSGDLLQEADLPPAGTSSMGPSRRVAPGRPST
jgi:hypothetical protein